MMRNWFILFTTTFTVTILILTIIMQFSSYIPVYNSQYILVQAILSLIISAFIILFNRLPIENIFLNILLDISFIFLVVFSAGIIINLFTFNFLNLSIVLSQVIIIYIIISLIYLFILKREAKDMNKKILHWRKKHVKRK